nr:putative ribonuclease H-like domain-containing protein [Tanacetum cinerariifolium]
GNPQQDLQDKVVIDSECSRPGHLNFKTMNKLVKRNLVRGLPSKLFENNQDCVACQKGKQHRAYCKFDGKVDERFFVGYTLNSNAFRVFNNRTRIVEENLNIRFSENIPNIVGSGANWPFDIDALTKSMNYKPVIAGNQSNGIAGKKAYDDAESKSSQDDGFQPSSDDRNTADEDPKQESECKDQENGNNVNNTNNVNAASTNGVNAVGGNTNNELPFDPEMLKLEDINTFNFSNKDEDNGAEANMNNLDTTIQVSPTPTIRIYKDHPLDLVISDLHSTTKTRNMSKNLEEHGFVTTIHQRTNHKDLQNCLFACFLSQ